MLSISTRATRAAGASMARAAAAATMTGPSQRAGSVASAAALCLSQRRQRTISTARFILQTQQSQQSNTQAAAPSSLNPHAARAASAAGGAAPAAPAATAAPASGAAAAAAAAPAGSSASFTGLPESMPALVPLSQVDLSLVTPRLAKHSTRGYLIYQSPMERAVKAVKMFSLSSAAMSIISAPVMLVLANPNMPMVGRVAIAGTVLTFGLATTVALTYFTRSYIIRVFAREDPAAAAAAIAAAPAHAPLSADDAAAHRWQLTVETFNVWGRPVFNEAPHANFHPLFSRLFNNVRVDLPQVEGQPKKHKDLFIHMDVATNPLMLPLWAKPTVVSSGKMVDLENADSRAKLGLADRVTISLKEATEKLEKINKEQAAKLAAEQNKNKQQ